MNQAVINAMVAARDMTGDQGRYAKAIPNQALMETLAGFGHTLP